MFPTISPPLLLITVPPNIHNVPSMTLFPTISPQKSLSPLLSVRSRRLPLFCISRRLAPRARVLPAPSRRHHTLAAHALIAPPRGAAGLAQPQRPPLLPLGPTTPFRWWSDRRRRHCGARDHADQPGPARRQRQLLRPQLLDGRPPGRGGVT